MNQFCRLFKITIQLPFSTFLAVVNIGFVTAFAMWTLAINALVFSGHNFDDLISIAPVIMILCIILPLVTIRAWLREERRFAGYPPNPPGDRTEPSPAFRLWSIGAVLAVVTIFMTVQNYWVFWISGLAVLAAVHFSDLWRIPMEPPLPLPGEPRLLGTIVVLCVLVMVAISIIVISPNADDSFFINMAVGAKDNPTQPLLRFDTIHGLVGVPILLPTYRVHSYELLCAAMSFASGLTVIQVMHLVWPPLFSFLMVVAITNLLGILAPKQWSLTLLTTFLLYIFLDVSRLANLVITHTSFGKGAFVAVIVPSIVWATIRWWCRPSLPAWLLLAASMIAAVGMTANALYVAPLTMGLVSASLFRPNRTGMRHMVGAITSAVYPILLAAFLLVTGSTQASERMVIPSWRTEWIEMFGRENWIWRPFLLFGFLGAWTLLERGLSRRLFSGLPLFFLALVANPLLLQTYAEMVTGRLNWRLFWTLPVYPMLGMLIVTALTQLPLRPWLAAGVAATLTMTVGLAGHSVFSSQRLFFGQGNPLKVNAEYAFAKSIVETQQREGTVLAPQEIALWIPTFEEHPFPIVARNLYLEHLKNGGHVAVSEIKRRLTLEELVEGTAPSKEALDLLDRALIDDDIRSIVVRTQAPAFNAIQDMADLHGYIRRDLSPEYVWYFRSGVILHKGVVTS